MPKTRQQKEMTLVTLTEKLRSMKAVVFTTFSGLSVKDTTELRNQLRAEKIDMLVAKKNLMRLALKDAGLDPAMIDQVDGSVAMVFGYEDEVLPAKLLTKFAKTKDSVKLVGGIADGQFMDGKQIAQFAKIPGKQELLTQTVWTLKSPITGLVTVLSGNIRGLLTILQALKDKQPAAA
jgi:large subunit ribosomal protein L10